MNLIRFLKNHVGVVVLIIVLLIAKAGCDLALPTYTSQIVDVGIQQSGVEDVACEVFTDDTFDKALILLSDSDAEVVRSSYDKAEDGLWHLNEEGFGNRETLNTILTWPLMALYAQGGAGDTAVAQALDAFDGTPETQAAVSEALDTYRGAAQAEFAAQDASGVDSLVSQQALYAAQAEYEKAGFDLSSLQMDCLLRIGVIMLAIAAAAMLLDIVVAFLASRTGARIGRDLRSQLFTKVVSFSEAEINKFSAASLITRGTNDIVLIQNVIIMLLRMVVYAPILAIGGVIMIMMTNASMGWIVVVAVVAVFVVIGVLFKLTLPRFRIMQTLVDKVNLVAREILTGLPVVRAFNRDEFEHGRFDAASSRLMRTQLFTNRAMAFMMPTMMLIMNLTSVAIVWFGAGAVDTGSIQTGDLIAFITYAMVIIMGFLIMGMVSIMLPRADVAAGRINEVLSCDFSVCDVDDPKPLSEAGTGVRIEFEDVSFGYDKHSEPVLEHISFVAEPGKTLAIVGSTGSGKSTIIKLIERFFDPDSGTVRVDGIDVRDISQEELRRQLGYVPQKAFLFTGTVKSNIEYGQPNIDEEGVRVALETASALEFSLAREGGLDSRISQGGTNVSGGQRQRLAMARALARKPRVYLFDDSFSALDYATDAQVRAALADYAGGSTKIIVAQRISTVLDADTIVVLDDGRMAGVGTHDELMQTCEEYREIALSQLSESELKGGAR